MTHHVVTPPKWWREPIFNSADAAAITETNYETIKSWQRAAPEPLGAIQNGRRYFTLHELYQLAIVGVLHAYGMNRPQFSYRIAREVSHGGENMVPRPPFVGEVANVGHDGTISETHSPWARLDLALDRIWEELTRRAQHGASACLSA